MQNIVKVHVHAVNITRTIIPERNEENSIDDFTTLQKHKKAKFQLGIFGSHQFVARRSVAVFQLNQETGRVRPFFRGEFPD